MKPSQNTHKRHDDDEVVADHFDLRLRQENRSMPGREQTAADAGSEPAVAGTRRHAPAATKKPQR